MRKTLALFLLLALCLSLAPLPVRAAENEGAASSHTISSSCFVSENGDLYQWRPSGTLYSTDEIIRSTPVKIEGISDVVQVTGDEYAAAAVTADGSLYTWGAHLQTKLGIGDPSAPETPVLVSTLSNVVSVSLWDYGDLTCAAVTADGSLYAWGDVLQSYGNSTMYSVPHKIEGVSDATAAFAGEGSRFSYIAKDGTLYSWGLPNGNSSPAGMQKVLSDVVSMSYGRLTACAVTADGTLYTWGYHYDFALGLSREQAANLTNSYAPQPIPILENIRTAHMGRKFYGLAVTNDGRLYTWGDYGDPNRDRGEWGSFILDSPTLLDCDGVKFIDAIPDRGSNIALTEDGKIYAWFGSLAPVYLTDGVKMPDTPIAPNTPAAEPTEIPIGRQQSIARDYYITENGDLYHIPWHYYDIFNYEASPSENVQKLKATKMENFSNIVSFQISHNMGTIITEDGSLYLREYQRIDPGTDTEVETFTKVEGLSHVVSADAWGNSGIAATADGSVYVWGNVYMGDDKNWNPIVEIFQTPQKVEGLSDVASVGCGSSIFAAVTNTGDLYTWGMGPSGETGYGEGQPKSSAVPKKILEDVAFVECGQHTTCAVTRQGDLYVWGGNFEHHAIGLDQPGTFNVLQPTFLMGNVREVSLGRFFGGAVTNDGELYLWGYYLGDMSEKHQEDYGFSTPTLIDTGGVRFADLFLDGYLNTLLSEDGGFYLFGLGLVPKDQVNASQMVRFTGGVKVPGQVAGDMGRFTASRTYQPGQFSDVDEGQWYGTQQQGTIRQAYELGLIDGMADGSFSPDSPLRLSEAIKLACTVRSIYTGSQVTLTDGVPWYMPYVDYGIFAGILLPGEFDDLTAYATRSQMAYLFANALPADELPVLDAGALPPDVSDSDPYAQQIRLLYQAGVLQGNDASGAFQGDQPITRAQATAILTRLALPGQRTA